MSKVTGSGSVVFKQVRPPPPSRVEPKKTDVAAPDVLDTRSSKRATVAPTAGEMKAYAVGGFELGNAKLRAEEAILDPDPKVRERVVAALEKGVEHFVNITGDLQRRTSMELLSVRNAVFGVMDADLEGRPLRRSSAELETTRKTAYNDWLALERATDISVCGTPDARHNALDMLVRAVVQTSEETELDVHAVFGSSEVRKRLSTMLGELTAAPSLALEWVDPTARLDENFPPRRRRAERSVEWFAGHRDALVTTLKPAPHRSADAVLFDRNFEVRERGIPALQSGVELFLQITKPGLARPLMMTLPTVRNAVVAQMIAALDGRRLEHTPADLDAIRRGAIADAMLLNQPGAAAASPDDASHLALDMLVNDLVFASEQANVEVGAIFESTAARSQLSNMLMGLASRPDLALGWSKPMPSHDDPVATEQVQRTEEWNTHHRGLLVAALKP